MNIDLCIKIFIPRIWGYFVGLLSDYEFITDLLPTLLYGLNSALKQQNLTGVLMPTDASLKKEVRDLFEYN